VWERIQCNSTTGRVTGLLLQRPSDDHALYMKGTLSPSVGNLHFLEVLLISGMKWRGDARRGSEQRRQGETAKRGGEQRRQ
ncbi:hypothetical protein U1Q18_034682, partial [Sarracenia purpurea var. burkii]